MVLGIGVDLVQINRFDEWIDYPSSLLEKVFNSPEFAFCCTTDGILIAEKLAVRFAAKEAFYKALSATLVQLKLNKKTFSFMSMCKWVSVVVDEWGIPVFDVTWDSLCLLYDGPALDVRIHLSLTHEKTMATAFVIIEGL